MSSSDFTYLITVLLSGGKPTKKNLLSLSRLMQTMTLICQDPNPALIQLRLIRLRPKTYVHLPDVLFVQGAGPYSIIRLRSGRSLRIGVSLSQTARRLPELLRTSRSVLVNLAYVKVMPRHSPILQLTTGQTLPVTRRRKAEARRRFLHYQSSQLTKPDHESTHCC